MILKLIAVTRNNDRLNKSAEELEFRGPRPTASEIYPLPGLIVDDHYLLILLSQKCREGHRIQSCAISIEYFSNSLPPQTRA